MLGQWLKYLWVLFVDLFASSAVAVLPSSGTDETAQNSVVLACLAWSLLKRRDAKEQDQPPPDATSDDSKVSNSSSSNLPEDVAMSSSNSNTAMVPVEERMNQVADAAPVEIGRVVESEINTEEDSTSTELTKDTDTEKLKEQSEEYEAKGTAVIIGTQGKTESSVEAKSKQSESKRELTEGNRKVFSMETSSSKSYSFEESTEYEY